MLLEQAGKMDGGSSSDAKLPNLPFEVIGLIAEQQSAMGHFGTLANLNVACKHIHRDTLPALWRRIYVPAGPEAKMWSLGLEDFERWFRLRFPVAERYKYIRYIVDERALLRPHLPPFNPEPTNPVHGDSPFYRATILSGTRMYNLGARARNDIPVSFEVRLGLLHRFFTDDLLDTVNTALDLPRPTLHHIASVHDQELRVRVSRAIRPAPIPEMTVAQATSLLYGSPPGWFPSSTINRVRVVPEIPGDVGLFNPDRLQVLALEMLNFIAVSVGKHILLAAQQAACEAPVLRMSGLSLEDVDNVLSSWFSVMERMPYYGGIRISLALDKDPTDSPYELAQRFQKWREPYRRCCLAAGETHRIEFDLLNPRRRRLVHLGHVRHLFREDANGRNRASTCLQAYDPSAPRTSHKHVYHERWDEPQQVEEEEYLEEGSVESD